MRTSRCSATSHAEVQHRFLDSSRGFGISRVVVMPPVARRHRPTRPMTFMPETPREMERVNQFAAAGVDLRIYMGRPSLLLPVPLPTTSPFSMWQSRPALEGPITVVDRADVPPPDVSVFRDQARRSLHVLRSEDVVQFTQDGWMLLIRPVRAMNDSCVDGALRVTASRPLSP